MLKPPTHGELGASGPQPPRGPATAARAAVDPQPILLIKRGIWAYFLLLIFEGALRKWVLPGLSTPLLVVRDPIALGVVLTAMRNGLMPRSMYVSLSVLLGVVSFAAAIVAGHGSVVVAAYGARPLLVHLPFAFVVGHVCNREDVLRFGRVVLLIAVPMSLLIGLQFYSPQSAWVNRGVGGNMEGVGFAGAMGYARPPGTFSFTNGTTAFFALTAAFVGYFWLEPTRINRRLLLLATAALIMAVPLSISRSLLFQIVIAGGFAVFAMAQNGKYRRRAFGVAVGMGIAAATVYFTPVFRHSAEVLAARFESASNSEGGLEGTLVDRFLGGLASAVLNAGDNDILGRGIGIGTNVGAVYTVGQRAFLVAEGEWGRTVGELGPVLGLIVILLRVSLAFGLLERSYHLARLGESLPWMLMSVGLLVIAQGGWAQPTPLGFFTVTLGLVLASLQGRSRAAAEV